MGQVRQEDNTTSRLVVYWALNGYGVSVMEIVVNCIFIIIAGWIITLNGLVFDTLVRLKRQRREELKPGDWLVSSLSFADMVSGIFLVYHTVYNLTNFQIRTECLVRNSMMNTTLLSSVFHLSLLTADRYVLIVFPFKYSTICTHTTLAVSIALTWVSSLLLSMLPLFGWNVKGGGVLSDGTPLPVCSFFGLMHPDYLRLIVFLFFTPCLLMMVFYTHIFKVASRHARVIAAQERSRSKEKHSWRFTKTVLIVIGLYFLAWLPAGMVIILAIEGYLDSYTVTFRGTLLMFCSLSAFSGSVINPIIYAVKIPAVRARFCSVFCRGRLSVHIETTQTAVVAKARALSEQGVKTECDGIKTDAVKDNCLVTCDLSATAPSRPIPDARL